MGRIVEKRCCPTYFQVLNFDVELGFEDMWFLAVDYNLKKTPIFLVGSLLSCFQLPYHVHHNVLYLKSGYFQSPFFSWLFGFETRRLLGRPPGPTLLLVPFADHLRQNYYLEMLVLVSEFATQNIFFSLFVGVSTSVLLCSLPENKASIFNYWNNITI